MTKLDPIDIKILNILQQDSRTTIKEIAAKLNLSTTPIFERIKRLEKRKVIKQYIALVDSEKLGKKLHVFIHISINDHSNKALEKFVQQVIANPEVLECHHVTGDADFLLKVIVEDISAYNKFVLEKLSKVDNVGKVQSQFSLSIRKQTNYIEVL